MLHGKNYNDYRPGKQDIFAKKHVCGKMWESIRHEICIRETFSDCIHGILDAKMMKDVDFHHFLCKMIFDQTRHELGLVMALVNGCCWTLVPI